MDSPDFIAPEEDIGSYFTKKIISHGNVKKTNQRKNVSISGTNDMEGYKRKYIN